MNTKTLSILAIAAGFVVLVIAGAVVGTKYNQPMQKRKTMAVKMPTVRV